MEGEFFRHADSIWVASAALFRPAAWLPRSWRECIRSLRYDRAILALPDRRFIESDIVPFLGRRGMRDVLFIGTRSYTRHYPALFARAGVTLWTMDVDPFAERYGAVGRHRTLDVAQLSPDSFDCVFDAVIFSGVIGFGVDSDVQVSRAASALGGLVGPGGTLILGWNTDRSADPLDNSVWRARFRRHYDPAFPGRVTFEGSTHVFDLLEPVSRD